MQIADVRLWALKGAELRLVEIAEEAKAIYRNFPELRQHGRGVEGDGAGRPRRRRRLSAEARKRISDAVKARWARQKGTEAGSETRATEAGETASEAATAEAPATKPTGQKRARRGGPRKMSAAARRRISAATKTRWAKFRAEKSKRARARSGKKK